VVRAREWDSVPGTGMRRGELVGLRWSDVDLEAGTATVNQTLQEAYGEPHCKEPKTTKSRRRITLPGVVVDALRAHRAEQAKKTLAREPISAHLVADIVTAAGANRVVSADLHAGQIQGFFDFPLDHVTAMPLLASYIMKKNVKDMVVVSPDAGRVKVAKKLSDRLHLPMAIMHKRRPDKNVAEIVHVIGEVDGKNCILIDDMVDTAGTMVEAADALKNNGAKKIYACATHPILSGSAVERIELSAIEELVVTNSLPLPREKKIDKITVLSIAPLLANTITAVFKEESVSEIVGGDNQA